MTPNRAPISHYMIYTWPLYGPNTPTWNFSSIFICMTLPSNISLQAPTDVIKIAKSNSNVIPT